MNSLNQAGALDGIPVNPPKDNENPDQQNNPHDQHISAWSSGLFDCCSDVKLCCMTYWCPCITFGRIAEIVDEGNPSCVGSGVMYTVRLLCTGYAWPYSCKYRSKIRKKYMLDGNTCGDCLVHWWCEGCALCQEYRELESRGFDMSIGWKENVARHTQGVAMASAPVIGGGMMR